MHQYTHIPTLIHKSKRCSLWYAPYFYTAVTRVTARDCLEKVPVTALLTTVLNWVCPCDRGNNRIDFVAFITLSAYTTHSPHLVKT